MINTVLKPISGEELGITLMHEHIMLDYRKADQMDTRIHDREEVAQAMLPYLLKLKDNGCQTLVDATPPGSGRDVKVLAMLAKRSGLNILTCTGTFKDKGLPYRYKEMDISSIVAGWEREYSQGIDDTGIRPAFIKIAFNEGAVTPLEEKIFQVAVSTSLKTGLPIQAHITSPEKGYQIFKLIQEEELPPEKFIWAHADCDQEVTRIDEVARAGIWIQLDSIGLIPYEKHINLIKTLSDKGLNEQILISQDRGWYVAGEDKAKFVRPYHHLFTKFIPLALKKGINQKELNQYLINNPKRVFKEKGE